MSCFGEKNGSIDLTITGDTAPYSILWSTSNIDEDIDSLPAGYYRVVVDDADTLTGPVAAEITLTEPRKIEAEIFIHTYNDRYNISAFDACNGIISFQPAGGVSPYQYLWNDNNTTNNRSNLCADRYIFLIEDANQCKYKSEYIILIQPDRNDWQMTGNSGIDPSTQYMGTSDSTDFVLRTNAIERLKIQADGSLNIPNFSSSDSSIIIADSLGNLRSMSFATMFGSFWLPNANGIHYNSGNVGIANDLPLEALQIGDRFTFHNGGSKAIAYNFKHDGLDKRIVTGPASAIYFTARGDLDLKVAESGASNTTITWTNALRVRNDGYILIGNPSFDSNYLLSVCGGIKANKVRIPANWCDFVFESNYDLMPLNSLERFISENHHLPGIPTQKEVESEGVDVAEILKLQMQKIEELTLYIIELQKQIDNFRK